MKLFVSLVCCLLFLCSVTTAQANSTSKKVYWHSENGDAINIDPIESATSYSANIVKNIYDTLYDYKYLKRLPYEIKPNLASAMPEVSKDGLTYTIKIKEGVVFANDPCFVKSEGKGREVVAEDFVYSIKRHFDPRNSSQGSWLWEGRIVGLDAWKKKQTRVRKVNYDAKVGGLKALDKYTIQIKLVKPYPQILHTFIMSYSAIVPKEAVEYYGYSLSSKAAGSGPFKLDSLNQDRAVIVKNPNFRKEIFDVYKEGYNEDKHGFTGIKQLHGKQLPIVDTVVFRFMPDPSLRWKAFTKSKKNQFTSISPDLLGEVLESKNPCTLKAKYAAKYHLYEEIELGFVMTIFNMSDPNIGYNDDPKRNQMNKALRKAIRKSFHWQERIDSFYNGIGSAFVGVIPPGISGYTDFPKDSITYDPEEAKRLLTDAGWTEENLPVIEYPSVSYSNISKQFFTQFRDWLIKIGYPKEKIKLREYMYFGDMNRAMKQGNHMMNPYGWGLDYPDAENTLQLFYGANSSPGVNASNFNHTVYNKLFEETIKMPDCPERTEKYKLMTEILLEECVGIFSFARTGLYMWPKDVIIFPTRNMLKGYFKYVDVKK